MLDIPTKIGKNIKHLNMAKLEICISMMVHPYHLVLIYFENSLKGHKYF